MRGEESRVSRYLGIWIVEEMEWRVFGSPVSSFNRWMSPGQKRENETTERWSEYLLVPRSVSRFKSQLVPKAWTRRARRVKLRTHRKRTWKVRLRDTYSVYSTSSDWSPFPFPFPGSMDN